MTVSTVTPFNMTKSLGRRRAERADDARAWSPIEMLEDLLREAKEGNVDLDYALIVFPGSSEETVSIRRAGCSVEEEFMLLRTAMKSCAGL